MRRVLDWAPVCLGAGLLATLVGLQWPRVVRGQNDFAALYAGAKLVGTPQLYSRAANEATIQSFLGATMQSVMYTRPPFYAAILKPLAALPYLAAYAIFCSLCLGAVIWFVARFAKECRALPLYASFSIPVAAFLPQGQDTPLLLIFLGSSILLSRRKRDFLAGLVFSLCAIKFHLFLLVPVLLFMKKRWRMLGGLASGGAILFLTGIAAAGVGSTAAYIDTLRNPWINFSADMMPNLHGLAMTIGAGSKFEIALSAAVIAGFLWIASRSDRYEFLLALAILCGLLVSYHSGIGDDILLLPVLVLMHATADKPLSIALAIALSPIPYFLGIGISVALPVLLVAILILAAVSVSRTTGGYSPAALRSSMNLG